MKNDLVAVLDLGDTKVACLAARAAPKGGGVSVEGYASFPCKGLKRGVVTDLEEAARGIDAAVRKVQQETGQEIDSLIVSISGSHVEGINAQGLKPIVPRTRHITYQDVLEVVNHSRSIVLPPDREQIQALPREFRIDGEPEVQKPIGLCGSKLEVITYIVTGQIAHIQNIERAVGMANKKVDQMVLKALASGIGVLTEEEIQLGAAVVDIGGGTTDVGVFTNGSIAFSASLPVGGQHVTSDLHTLLKTAPEEAERLKIAYGAAYAKLVPEKEGIDVMQIGQALARPMQRKVMCEIIESRMREIAEMVGQQIEKSGLIKVLPGGVVLTGGASALPGSDKLFEDKLKHLRVRVAEPDLGLKYGRTLGSACSFGLARFAIQCFDEITPAIGNAGWKDRVRSLFSIITGG